MEEFFCCLVEGSFGFSHRHNTIQEAELEAVRLARKEGKRVFILEAVAYCQPAVTETPIEWGDFKPETVKEKEEK